MKKFWSYFDLSRVREERALKILSFLKDGQLYDQNKIPLLDALNQSIRHTSFVPPDFILERPPHPNLKGKIIITRENVIDAAYRLVVLEQKSDVLLLNFASGDAAGGGFLKGSQAQEEELCRHSGLYPGLFLFSDKVSSFHWSSPYFSDAMVFSRNVPFVFATNQQPLEKFYSASILSAAAVRMSNVVHQPNFQEDVDTVLFQRIKRIVEVARFGKCRVLVLGAFGCGAYRCDPVLVSQHFKTVLDHYGKYFDEILFPIYGSNDKIVKIFSHTLGVPISQ